MTELHREKLINIVANAALESRLVEIAIREGATGYTVTDARGGGASGTQYGVFDSDSNIHFMMIAPDHLLQRMLDELSVMIRKGHHMVVYVSNTEVLRKKNQAPE
ncbi:MAG: transcriptional regulator [Gammaproteobacteria bacterium]|nr:transcriptional regulator [Gammaproteobacteria bacterium]MBU2478819.1 transcriptional regulator [Gammaproteobacteria bacterium]